MEPAIFPLGLRLENGYGILSSFAAREVLLEQCQRFTTDDETEEQTVIEKMKADVKPNGEKVFNFCYRNFYPYFYAFAM